MTPAEAQTVHGGYGLPDGPRFKRIQEWLKANGIEPRLVASNRPIYVLVVPNGTTIQGGVPWLIDVIVFHEYYENSDGAREINLISREAIAFQRTVPLKVPFPADPTTEGDDRGQADQQAAQEAPEVEVRPAWQAPLSDRHQGSSSECAGPRSTERIEEHPEDHPREGHEALAQPEEDRQQPGEEVKP